MRGLRLARIAAQAELLRLRLLGRRQAMRVVLAVVAGVFLLACLALLHVAAYQALELRLDGWLAALIVAAVDLVITLIFAAFAMRDSPSGAEREALQVHKSAELQLAEAVAITSLTGPILRMLGTRRVYGVVLAALTARYLGRRL